MGSSAGTITLTASDSTFFTSTGHSAVWLGCVSGTAQIHCPSIHAPNDYLYLSAGQDVRLECSPAGIKTLIGKSADSAVLNFGAARSV